MLNRAEPLSQLAYVPYSTNAADYVAPFSPLQKQAQAGAANLQTPSQFAPATQMAGVSGIGQLGTAGQALGYGAQSADLGMQAAGMAGQGYGAGAQYAQQATSPTAIGAYMNPYIQQSLAPQLQLLNQQYGIKQAQQQGAATQAGAFGGSREALQGGLINQGQALAQQEMIAQGYNQAFGQAQQAQQFGANLGLQGMQAGNQAMQTGLQGLGQGLTGVNTALQGYQQGMAGSQAGLAGVQGAQQGFTGAANTAATLGNLGTAQLGAETSVLGTQAQFGAQQQAQQQQAIDQAVLNYQNAQQYPYMQLGFMSNLLRGTPINNTTETQYMAQPSAMQQIGGALGTAGSLYGAYTAKKAEGGRIQDNSYAKGGIVGYLEGGSVEESMRSKLEDLDVSHLQQIIQSTESPEMSKLAKEVLATKFAKGGIVAFAKGGTPPNVLRDPAYYEDIANYTLEDLAAESDPEVRASRIDEWNRKYGKPKATELLEPEHIQPKPVNPNLSENEALNTLKNKPKGLATIPGEDVVRPPANEGILTRRGTGLATIPGEEVIRPQKGLATIPGEGVTVERPESATAEGSPKATGKGLTAIKGLAPVALKTLGTLSLPELVDAMTGQPEDSKTFKEYEAIKKKSGMKGVLAHMNEQVAEGNAKVAKGIAAFASENIAEPVKEWWLGEDGQTQQPVTKTAVTPSAPAGIDSQAQAPLQKQESPYSADAYNPVYTQRKQPAVTPPVGGARQSIVPSAQPSFGGTPEESEILQANLASEPEGSAKAGEVANAKTEQDMGFYQKQVAEMYKQAGLGNNEGAAAMRKEIMDELANKEANEKRQTYLRMAEFFSHWGSTPGAPLAAGMRSLIATMPGYLEDKKDQEKLQRGLQDSLYKLDQADRLEKIGMIKEAAALKHDASQFDKEVMKLQHEAVQNRLQEAAAERRAKIMAGASTTNAVIGATSRIDGTTSDTYRGNNIKALQNQATNITRQMANLLPESKELPGLKAQLKNVNDRMDALIDESGAKPKTRYDRWLTETGKI
jgi:hypothetical protein